MIIAMVNRECEARHIAVSYEEIATCHNRKQRTYSIISSQCKPSSSAGSKLSFALELE